MNELAGLSLSIPAKILIPHPRDLSSSALDSFGYSAPGCPPWVGKSGASQRPRTPIVHQCKEAPVLQGPFNTTRLWEVQEGKRLMTPSRTSFIASDVSAHVPARSGLAACIIQQVCPVGLLRAIRSVVQNLHDLSRAGLRHLTGGEHRSQPVLSIVSHASMALCLSILRRVCGIG